MTKTDQMDREIVPLGHTFAFGTGLWRPDDPVRWWHRLLGRRPDLEKEDSLRPHD